LAVSVFALVLTGSITSFQMDTPMPNTTNQTSAAKIIFVFVTALLALLIPCLAGFLCSMN
jgi:hypothetical protein